jgi:integrase/recombinase XerD
VNQLLFPDLVAEFDLVSRAQQKQPSTIAGQAYSLRVFAEWLRESETDLDPRTWTVSTIRQFSLWLQKRPARYGGTLSPVTVNSVVRVVRTFCNWMREEGYITEHLFGRKGLVPRMPQLYKAALTHEEFNRIMEAARKTRYGRRNEAILLFMIDTGVRARELLGMLYEDVDLEQRTGKVRGKGNKDRVLFFSETTARAMLRYVNGERFRGEYFFTSEKYDGQLSYSGLSIMFMKLSEATGIHVHAHKLRHTSATWLAASGANAFEIQQQLGHSSMEISLRYVHLNDGNRKTTIDRHSPVEQARRARKRRD